MTYALDTHLLHGIKRGLAHIQTHVNTVPLNVGKPSLCKAILHQT